MKHLWKVEFEIKYSGLGEWLDDADPSGQASEKP
jgi:hypothetical protein